MTIVNETNTTSFTCTVFGIPTPVVEWLKLDADSSSVTVLNTTQEINITQVSTGNNVTSVLHFPSPVKTDEAMYMCRGTNNVTNVINSPENSNMTLYVQGVVLILVIILNINFIVFMYYFLYIVPAIVNQNPVSVTNYTAGTASLSCVVGGLPVVSIVWLKNGQPLSVFEDVNVTISSTPTSTSTTGQVTSTLTFNDLVLDDAALYQCVGNNTGAPGIEFTVTSAAATLTVQCK